MGARVELDCDRLTSQGARIVVGRVRAYNNSLTCYRRPEGNDLCTLPALVGPTDLPFFSSTVDRNPAFLERHMAEHRIDLGRIMDWIDRSTALGPYEFHVYPFFSAKE